MSRLAVILLLSAVVHSAIGQTSTRSADGFDFPVAPPNATGFYKSRGFRANGHLGEDWVTDGGSAKGFGLPVCAIGNGVVVLARDIHVGWGNVVIVRHAWIEHRELQFADSLYAHLDRIRVREGQQVLAGTLLFTIDDSVQRATMELAESNLKVAQDQYDKRRSSYDIDPKSISKDVLDTAKDAVIQAASALKAANELLKKYSIKAPVGGVIFAVNAATGSYVSSQGAYDSYTQGFDPLVVMGTPQEYLAVRCYVDEILVSRLPSPGHIRAQMSIRGSDVKVPLEFVRIQPYVSPKIELSNQRQEQVDLRVLPVIFRFEKKDAPVYPGQLVDVYIGQQ